MNNFGGTKLNRNYIWVYANKKVEYYWSKLLIKVKSPLCSIIMHYAMKTYGGGGVQHLGARWRLSGQLHASTALSPGKGPSVPIG
jgi:hypothetical protein